MDEIKSTIKIISVAIVASNIASVFVLNHSIASVIISDIFCIGCCIFHQFVKAAVNDNEEKKKK